MADCSSQITPVNAINYFLCILICIQSFYNMIWLRLFLLLRNAPALKPDEPVWRVLLDQLEQAVEQPRKNKETNKQYSWVVCAVLNTNNWFVQLEWRWWWCIFIPALLTRFWRGGGWDLIIPINISISQYFISVYEPISSILFNVYWLLLCYRRHLRSKVLCNS